MDINNYQLTVNSKKCQNIATILHGAYGDYFEQLLCIADLIKKNPQHKFHLFFANKHRMIEFSKLDLGLFATVAVAVADTIESIDIDLFYQFQVFDAELKEEVLDHLSEATLSKMNRNVNLLPHIYMHKIQEQKKNRFPFVFNELGKDNFQEILSTLPKNTFQGKTIGFMWRYRGKNGAVSPFLMPDKEVLINKYSQVFRSAIEEWNCNIIIAGMKVITTEENINIVDRKFPEYGLNFQHENLHYLPGKGWLAEVELLSQCDIVICHPSGFSEAIFLKGKECLAIDIPLHYVLKTIKNSFPLFDIGLTNLKQLSILFRSIFQRHTKQFLNKKINIVFSKKK